MYRPIDVIFRHPIKKFTVIYQNGVLWQLPKLEIDRQSLQNKKRYRGSRQEIFVAANQKLDTLDTDLAAQLLTIELPASIVGRNVDEFDRWWRHNWFKYSEVITQKIISQKNVPKSQLSEKIVTTAPTTAVTTAVTTKDVVHTSDAMIDDVLDQMLQALLDE